MAKIDVREVNAETFHVTVTASSTTEHEVNVQPEYALKLCGGTMSTLELVKKSFAFLLDRESNTSILRKFDLRVINQYFPEYESEMCK
jgi:hypothetical protein